MTIKLVYLNKWFHFSPRLPVLGVPTALDPADLASSVSNARQLLNEESIRAGPSETRDPGLDPVSAITDSDLAASRAKFPFLKEFSDGFIPLKQAGLHNEDGNSQYETQGGGAGQGCG